MMRAGNIQYYLYHKNQTVRTYAIIIFNLKEKVGITKE